MRLIFTSVLLLIISSASAQSLFLNTYGTLGAEERAFDMVVLADGSVITIGDRYDTSTFDRTGYLLKVDADGNEEWNRQLISNELLYGTTISLLPNGNVFVAGYDYDVPNQDYGIVVAEYNANNGLPIYQQTHEFLQDAKAKDSAPTSDNGAIVLSTYETASDNICLLVRFNSDGDTVWTKTVNPFPGKETPAQMALISDGIIISGSVHTGSTDNIFVAKVDLDGTLLWQWEFETTGLGFAEGLVEIPSGGFYLTGTATGGGSSELQILVSKFDATGTSTWVYDYGSFRNDLGYDVDLMPDGGAIFAGSAYKSDTSNFRDLVLIRTDANGEEIWTRYFGDIGSETGYAVKVDGDQIVACGKGDVNSSEDIVILRVNFDGNTGVGINDAEADKNWSIFPNPFVNQVQINLNSITNEPVQIQIFDLAGKAIYQTTITNSATINLNWLSSGAYIIRAETQNQAFSTRLIKTD